MKSREIRILSTSIAFLFTAAVLTGCGDAENEAENTDWTEKSAEIGGSGATIIEPEPISSFETVEDIQSLDGLGLEEETASMEGILGDLTDTFGDTVDEAGDAISETTNDLMSALDDTPSVEDVVNEATEINGAIADTVESAVVEPIAKIVEDANEVVAATPDLIRRIQQALANAGYKPGPADGISGPRTLNALNSFQRDNNLASGDITKETLRVLGVDH